MSKLTELDAYGQLKRGLTDVPTSQVKVQNAQIAAKVEQAISSYPAWAKTQRKLFPPQQATQPQQAPTTQAAPTALPGYAQKRADAAARAQADLARGGQPAKQPTTQPAQASGTSVDIAALKQRSAQQAQASQKDRDTARQQIATTQAANAAAAQADNALVAAVKAAKAKPAFARDAQDKLTLKRGAAKGIYENKFSHLYAMLESFLHEQTNDAGSFRQYLQKVVQIDFDNNPQMAKMADEIDTLFSNQKYNDGYKLARQILKQHYQTQAIGRGGISTGIQSSGQMGTSADRIIANIEAGRLNQNELQNILLQSLLRLKTKFPSEYAALTRDIKGAVADYESKAAQTTA
jgi:hypothetical protein